VPGKENFMNSTTRLTEVRNPRPLSSTSENGNPTFRPRVWQTARKAVCRRLGAVTVGFWLGGFALGIAGCSLGACLPHRQPVGAAISMLWWGVYLGCFGASIGALFGLWWDHTRAPPRASGHRRQIEAATGTAAREDRVTSSVLEDRSFETSYRQAPRRWQEPFRGEELGEKGS
jgi:hypothetical protein